MKIVTLPADFTAANIVAAVRGLLLEPGGGRVEIPSIGAWAVVDPAKGSPEVRAYVDLGRTRTDRPGPILDVLDVSVMPKHSLVQSIEIVDRGEWESTEEGDRRDRVLGEGRPKRRRYGRRPRRS